MRGKFLIALVAVVLLVAVESTGGCKKCGSPWCSAEEGQERVELTLFEPRDKKHHRCVEHDNSDHCSVCGAPKCLHRGCNTESRPPAAGHRLHLHLGEKDHHWPSKKLECKCKTKKNHRCEC